MSILTINVLGVKLWIIFYFFLSIIFLLSVVSYFYKEKIKKKYYTLRYAEKVIKVVVHYETGIFKEYYKIIPKTEIFQIGGQVYAYNDKNVIKETDFFIKDTGTGQKVNIYDTEYDFDEELCLKGKGRKFIEIHYFNNNPAPLDFKKGEPDTTAFSLDKFEKNNLIIKLLSMKQQSMLFMMILIIVIFNLLATIFIIAHLMGWLE